MDEPKFEPHVWDEMPSSSHGMERLPISPYTGEPYDPSWATPLHGGIRIRKGRFAKDIHRQRRTRKKQGEQLLKWLGMALIVCGTALTLAGITGSLFTLLGLVLFLLCVVLFILTGIVMGFMVNGGL